MNYYIYERFSTSKQDCEQQRAAIEHYTKSMNIEAFSTVSEQESGSVSYLHREFKSLLEQLKSGDFLLVSELSRLSRDCFDGMEILKKFVEIGVNLVDCKRFITYDCRKLTARDKDYIFRDFNRAEEEKEFLVYRVNNGITKAKKDGVNFGRASENYGKKKDKERDLEDIAEKFLEGREKAAETKNKNVIYSERTNALARLLKLIVPEYAAYSSDDRLFFIRWNDVRVKLTMEQKMKAIDIIKDNFPVLMPKQVGRNLTDVDIYNYHHNFMQSITRYREYNNI